MNKEQAKREVELELADNRSRESIEFVRGAMCEMVMRDLITTCDIPYEVSEKLLLDMDPRPMTISEAQRAAVSYAVKLGIYER